MFPHINFEYIAPFFFYQKKFSLVCLMIFIPGLFSLQNVNFSGEWILNKEKSSFGLKLLEKLEKAVAVIIHKEPSFILKRVFTLDGQDDSLTLELTTDGKEKISSMLLLSLRLAYPRSQFPDCSPHYVEIRGHPV